MKITFDTNVLLHNLSIVDSFSDLDRIILLPVISELDNIKMSDTKSEELKFKSRKAIKYIQEKFDNKKLNIENYEIVSNIQGLSTYTKVDDLIIAICKDYELSLVTMDFNVYLKCNALGVNCFLMDSGKQEINQLYKGYEVVQVEDSLVDYMYKFKELVQSKIDIDDPYPNMFILAQSIANNKKSFIARYKNNKWILVDGTRGFYKDFKPMNMQQVMLLDLLLDDDVDIITVTGSIGTGKTFEVVGTALDLMDKNKYSRLLLSKCINPLSKWLEIGFLKGEKDDKLIGHFNNYLSTLENLHQNRDTRYNTGQSILEYKIDRKEIELLDLNSVIGSSFQGKIIIVDEAQGLDTDSMRSILTRIDTSTNKKSKLILMGDLKQNLVGMKFGMENGLYRAIESLKSSKYVGHITLENTTRGKVVEDVAKLYDNFKD